MAWVVACAGSKHGNQCYKETCSPQGARWPNLLSVSRIQLCSCHNWLSPLQVDEIAKPLASTKEEIFVVSFVSLMIGNWEVADSFWFFFFWKTPFWQRKVLMAEVEETFLIWRPWLLTVPANDQRGQRPRSHVKSWEVLNMTNPQQRTFVAMCIEINCPKKANHVKNHWSPDQLFCFMQVFGRAKRYRSHAWESSRLGNVNDGANDHCDIAALFPYFSRLWMKGALFIDPNPNPKKTLFSWCFPSGIEMQTVFFGRPGVAFNITNVVPVAQGSLFWAVQLKLGQSSTFVVSCFLSQTKNRHRSRTERCSCLIRLVWRSDSKTSLLWRQSLTATGLYCWSKR